MSRPRGTPDPPGGEDVSRPAPTVGILPPSISPLEKGMSRFLREPPSVRNALVVVVTATTVVVISAGAAMRLLDPRDFSSVWLGIWWSVQTVTTVGYGDVTPTNAAGRIVATLVMLAGIGFVAITTAAVTSTFVARAQRERRMTDAAQARAPGGEDARFDDLTLRLDRIESLLRDLEQR
jgi:voltage-gated potassium channel